MLNLSKHPFDWIVHETLNFVFVSLGLMAIKPGWWWFIIGTAIFVSIMIEFEQWNYSGRQPIKEYFYSHVQGDLIADSIGIILGVLV